MKKLLIAGVIAGTALATVAAAPNADITEVDVDGTSVTVTGTLAEPLGAVVLATDAPDDAVGSGYGHDVTDYSISFPRANTMAFHLAIADANPATGHGPHGSVYEIAPNVGGVTTEYTATATADGGLSFGAQTCAVNPDTNVNECSTTPVDGSYADGVITWEVPLSAAPGAQITHGHGHVNLLLGTGATGGVTLVNGILDIVQDVRGFGAVPSATLLLDGEPAGTARLSDGGYSVSATDVAPGEYAGSVELCNANVVDFTTQATECATVDLGTITVGDTTALDGEDTGGDTA